MDFFRGWASVLILLSMFFAGALITYLMIRQEDAVLVLTEIAGGNILSPVAIVFSATAASIAAYVGLHENTVRQSKDVTISALRYKRYTWAGLRTIETLLLDIEEKKKDLSDKDFDQYVESIRDTNTQFGKLISFLDSYQQVAFGIRNGLFDDEISRLLIQDKARYLFERAYPYIEWRRNCKRKGPADFSAIYADLESVVKTWSKIAETKR